MRRRIFCLILAGCGLLSACGKKKDAGARLDTFPVKTAQAGFRDIEETIILVGSIRAKDEAALFSRVPGKLKENLLKEGDPVSKGQAVALVERDEVGVLFEPAPVPSTLNGTVARVYLDRGENVTLQTPVALVVDSRETIVRADLPERYAARVSVGQTVRVSVDAYSDQFFKGRVWKVSPVVDPATRSMQIEAKVENPAGRLHSGMFGEVMLITGSRPHVVAVPKDALSEGSGPSVFVVENGKAVKREVEVGLQGDLFFEIRKGVRPGEKVVIFGLYGLQDGSSVEVLSE